VWDQHEVAIEVAAHERRVRIGRPPYQAGDVLVRDSIAGALWAHEFLRDGQAS
jgi:hypothetical protein